MKLVQPWAVHFKFQPRLLFRDYLYLLDASQLTQHFLHRITSISQALLMDTLWPLKSQTWPSWRCLYTETFNIEFLLKAYIKKATEPPHLFCTGFFPKLLWGRRGMAQRRSRSQRTKRKEEMEWNHSGLSLGVSLAAIKKNSVFHCEVNSALCSHFPTLQDFLPRLKKSTVRPPTHG